MALLIALIAALVVAVVILIFWLIISYEKIKTESARRDRAVVALADYKVDAQLAQIAARKDAVAKSKQVVRGKVAEHLVPWMEGFNFDPRDVRFLGGPVDLIVFEGMTNGDLERIVLVEIKTGKSGLSSRERQIRDAVHNGEYAFITGRVDDEGRLTWSV